MLAKKEGCQVHDCIGLYIADEFDHAFGGSMVPVTDNVIEVIAK